MRASAVSRWIERAWIRRTNPRDSIRQSGVPVGGQNESEVAVLAASERGGHRRGISLDLGSESLESFIGGLAMNSSEHLVLEVSVINTGKFGGHGLTREKSLSCVTTYEVNQ